MKGGRDQWSWVIAFPAGPDLFMQLRPSILYVCLASHCGDCQELADRQRQQSAVRSGDAMWGGGGMAAKGVTRCSVLRAPCSSRGVPVRWLSRATGVWKPVGCFLYLLWPLPSTFCFCSCIFYDSFTCARVGFCKWQFYRFVVDVCSLNASLVLPPPLPVTPGQTSLKCF